MTPKINQHNKLAAHILRDGRADRVFIHGPSGVGKTTLAKAFAKPGDILIDATPGVDIDRDVLLSQDHDGRVIVLSDRPLRDMDISDRCVTVLARSTSAMIERWSKTAIFDLVQTCPFAETIAEEATSPGHAVGLAETVAAAMEAGVSAATALRQAIGTAKHGTPLSMELIIARVADYYNARASDIIGNRRTKTITLPRHVAMHMCKERGRSTLTEIGAVFGGRDHSTVLHACNKIRRLLIQDHKFRAEYESCEASVVEG